MTVASFISHSLSCLDEIRASLLKEALSYLFLLSFLVSMLPEGGVLARNKRLESDQGIGKLFPCLHLTQT